MHAPEMLFEFKAQVRMHEVGPGDKTPIEVLLRYFQEAAGLHAEKLQWGIEELMQHNLVWVLSRLCIEVDRYPGAWEQITVQTWPVSRVKYIARRDFRIVDGAGLEIARGISNWVMMDVDARRMKTIPEAFSSMFDLSSPPPVMELPSKKVPALVAQENEAEIVARLEDMDRNGHANNTHIAAWMLEPVSAERMLQMSLKSLDVQFRAEVCRCERLTSLCGDGDAHVLHHSLVKEDGAEAARCKTTWALI